MLEHYLKFDDDQFLSRPFDFTAHFSHLTLYDVID